MQQDINVQLIVKSPTEGWTPLIGYSLNGEEAGSPTTSTLLLSDNDPQLGGPSATGDISFEGNGILFDANSSQYVVPGGASLGRTSFRSSPGPAPVHQLCRGRRPAKYRHRPEPVFSENTCYINMLPLLNQGYLGNMPAIVLQPQLPGDAVGDGRVDINDLTIVLTDFGKTGMTWNTGDFNGDGRVDINDLTVVLANFSRTVGAAGIGAVPEPARWPCSPWGSPAYWPTPCGWHAPEPPAMGVAGGLAGSGLGPSAVAGNGVAS